MVDELAKKKKLDKRDYTIGWICALYLELAASTGMLDEEHEDLDLAQGDKNMYTLGSIGGHNIVMACLPSGNMGITPAAKLAADMLRSFPKIRFGLMVGIGGGAPKPHARANEDIRLGDVVVSIPQGELGGVVKYDRGKVVAGGEFEHTGLLNQPPSPLTNAVAKLQGIHEKKRNAVSRNIDAMIKKVLASEDANPDFEDQYQCPGIKYDMLFEADYEHNEMPGPSEDQPIKEDLSDDDSDDIPEPCRNCDKARLAHRKARKVADPVIHYGTIASADRVMRHGITRERIRKKYGVLCFEMEAAGLMNDFPCLVIRGICDYSDTHKHKIWQRYAAATAAAYAKELLGVVLKEEIEKSKDMVKVLGQDKHEEDQKENRKYILTWLSNDTHSAKFIDTFQKWEPNTAQTFLQSQEYLEWANEDARTLWCVGIAGGGKSIFSSVVVEKLRSAQKKKDSRSKAGVACLFLEYERQQHQTTQSLTSAILRQLVDQCDELPESVVDLYDRHQENKMPLKLNECLTALSDVIHRFSQVFLVVDALDECSDEICRELMSSLLEQQRKTGLKIFVTSRPTINFQDDFDFEDCKRLEIKAEEQDVKIVLDKLIERLPRLIRTDEALRDRVKNDIASAVSGMFVLVEPFLDSLKGARSLGDVEAALTALTESSDKELTVYDRAMDRIDSQAPKDTELAHRVLSWIVESKRPLTHEELNHALAIKTGHIKFDREYLQHNLDDTVALCAGLIVINQKSNTVQLMHHTTRKYFEDYKTRSDWLKAAAGMLASACLTYVSYSEFAKGPCSDDRPLERRLRIYPFLEYAAQHWGNHARDDSARTADVEELALNFLEDSEKVNSSNQVMYLTEQRYEGYSQEYTRHANGLHIAAFFGLRKIAERLIFNGADVKETDEGGTTAMHLAAENGHDEVVLVLVKNGANIDARETKYGQTPLHLAALNGHKAVAETLLQNDALANLKDHEGWMAIHVAVWTGKGEVVQVLLESIDVNETGKDKLTALHCAAAQGHKILAQLLIDKKANVNAEDSDGWTPLHWASKKRHDIMKPRMLTIHDKPSELLRQIVAKQEEMRTLLRQQTIIIQDKLAVIKNPLAVWHGRLAWLPPEIGLDMMDGRYDDVVATLHFATTVQDIVLPNSSRERNEQPTAPSRLIFAIQDELTALHCSIECGHEPVGRLLLENGADIDGECKTKIEVKFGFKVDVKPNALHLAAFSGHEAMVRLLLEQGADVHAKCITGLPITFTDPIKMIQDFDELPHAELNAMHFAVMSGNDEIVELLIRKRADIQTTCLISAEDVRLELTPLHLAVVWGHVKLVQQLLSNGASVNARCEMSFQVKFKVRGSNMSVKSFMIRTDLSALHLAILSRRIDIIELLLKNKADIQTKVHVNLGPVYLQLPSLHIALLCAQSEVVTLLLESEANVRAELLISKGEKMLAKITVLHLATLVRETDVARQLIEKGADIHARFTIDINDWKPFRRRERHKSELQPEDPEESPMKGAIKRALRHTLQLVGAFIGEEIADFSLIKKATGIYREHSEDIQKVHIELTALHLAAMLGRNELLKLYVEKGVDPNVTFSVNFSDNQSNIVMTALHLAILWNHQETTELLLNSGANIHVQLSINLFNVLHVKATVLQLTVVSGSPELVRLVLDRGSNINTECHVTVGKVHTKITALHLAILLQKEETAYLLVGQGIDVKSSLLVQIGGHDIEFKAIHLAAATGSEGVVQLLLDNGYTGNEYGRVGNGTENQLTALHFAVAFSHEPVARLLINNGADVSTKLCVKLDSLLDVELTILHLAVMSGNLNMIQLLFDNGIVAGSKGKVATHKGRAELTGLTELHLAALWNRQEIIEQLLKADSDVHATCFITVEGGLRAEFTLLHIAAVVGNKDTVKTLIGAQLNPQTRAVLIGNSIHTELTTLHLAVLWRRLGAAEVLLDAGGGAQDDCLLKIQSFQIKLTSVHIAVLWRHHPMFRLLLEKEINVLSNLQITGPDTYAELSALHAAALYREPRMFHTLLQYGADANARFQFDFDEGYADVGVLHLVAALGSYNMMSTLLSTAPLGDYPSPALPPRSRFRSRSRSRSRRFSYSSSYLSLSSYSRSRSGSPSRPLSRSRSRSHSRGRMPVRRLRLRTSQPLESRSLARSRSESRVIGRSPARFESRSESLSPTRQRSHQFSVSPSKPRFTTRSRSRSLTQERIPRRGRNLNRHRASHSRSLSVSSQNVHSPGPSNKHSDKSSQNSEYPDTQENRTSIKTALPQPDIPAGDTPEEQSRRNSRGSSSRISRQKTRETFRKSYSDISAQPPNLRERTSKADVDAPFLLNIGKMHIQLSAIHIAALFRSTQKMQLLLDNNVDVNTLLEYNTENIRVELTPVQVAILSKSDSMIENLIETGADIHTVLKVATSDAYLELSTLHLAALASKIPATTDASRIDVVELLLKVGADVQRNCPIGVRKKVQTEITLLHLVILSAQDELTDLLSKGVDVRTKAMANLEIWLHSALTPLDVAALLNDEFLMEVFQDKGAKPMHEDRADSYVNSIRQLAHLLAAATGIQRLEEFVLSSINSIDEPFKIKLQAKMETAFPVTLQAPVESAFDINLEVELSALPLAAALGNMKVIDVLIQKGADLDTVCKINVGETTHTELTALHLATIWKTDEAMNLLLEKGANPLAMGQVKFTGTIQKQLIAPHLTTLVGHDGFLRLLKKNNEIETKIQVQLTVLHLAALLDDTIVAGLILDHGIDANLECLVNIEAKASTTFEANVLVQLTALHVAAWAGHDRIVLLLLKNGASVDSTIRVGGKAALGPGLRVNRKIQAGGTALHLAAGLGHEKIVQILINNGANIYCKSQDGRTAMQWASSNKHEAVMRLIHAKKQSLDSQKKRSHNESLATGHDDNKRFLERVQSMLSKDNPSADTNEGRDNTSLTQTGDLPHQNANVYRKEGVARYLMRLVAEKADNGIHKMRRGIFSDPDPETDQAETENIPEESPDDPLD